MPVSITEIFINEELLLLYLYYSTWIEIDPFSVNLRAFPTKLIIIYLILY